MCVLLGKDYIGVKAYLLGLIANAQKRVSKCVGLVSDVSELFPCLGYRVRTQPFGLDLFSGANVKILVAM